MQIFEITARKVTQEAINPGAVIGALGSKLAAYNAQQAGLSMPNNSASGGAYGDMRAKAAVAADPLINQMAADELANWNRTLTNAMQSSGVDRPGALPPQVKQSLSDSFMSRLYGYFLDGQLGNDFSKLPQYVDKKSQSEAAILMSKLLASIRAIRNYNSPASTPEGQFQQWRDLSKVTYDIRSLMQFNSANNRAQAAQAAPTNMPIIAIDRNSILKIGSSALNYSNPVHANISALIRSLMSKPTSPEPTVIVTANGDVVLRGDTGNYPLDSTDSLERELIRIIKAEVKKLNP
jgi:sulfur carrier protein ThiS